MIWVQAANGMEMLLLQRQPASATVRAIPARQRRRAFVLIELLLVVAVLLILSGGYFGYRRLTAEQERSTYDATVEKGATAACLANRAALRSSVEIFRMQNSRTPPTAENLAKAGIRFPPCPGGGVYSVAPDGAIVCSKHSR